MKKIKSNTAWRILKNTQELEEVQELLKEYQLWEPTSQNIMVRFGYHNLSAADKETYYLLRDLALISEKKTGTPICTVSLEYLAIVLHTSEECQRLRIKKLISAELVQVIHRRYNCNQYNVNISPPPDSTFVETIHAMIQRKQLSDLVYMYKENNNIAKRLELLQEIKDIVKLDENNKTITRILKNLNITNESQDIVDILVPNNLFNENYN